MHKTMTLFAAIAMLALAGAAHAGGDAAAGEAKAANCGGCHGANGAGTDSAPALAGLDEELHVQKMMAFKAGEGDPMMAMFAGQLSDEDIADIAAYYATLGGE